MDRLDRLKKCNVHLSIALAELNKIAGGSYVGSMGDLRELICVKLKLESVIKKAERVERWENKINKGASDG